MAKTKLASKILSFLSTIDLPIQLPHHIQVMHPYKNEDVMDVCQRFYNKFYPDNKPRLMLIGINPGRFGGGITGIPFTDPIRLQQDCAVDNPWPQKQELSSVFMYEMMQAYGGVKKFYADVYVTAISPLGFTRDQKNLNYYDDRSLQQDIEPFVINCMEEQISWGMRTDVAFCLGEGKNFQYLKKLNERHQWFGEIHPLPHPRFIMQYKLKQKQEYIQRYVELFQRYQ